jgi:hypothetical protein
VSKVSSRRKQTIEVTLVRPGCWPFIAARGSVKPSQDEAEFADPDLLAVGELCLIDDAVVAVGAGVDAKIGQACEDAEMVERGVAAGDGGVGDHDVAIGAATSSDDAQAQDKPCPGPRAAGDPQQAGPGGAARVGSAGSPAGAMSSTVRPRGSGTGRAPVVCIALSATNASSSTRGVRLAVLPNPTGLLSRVGVLMVGLLVREPTAGARL